MSSLGRLVAGVAHEINNPVRFIYGNLTFLEEHFTALLSALQYYHKVNPEVLNTPELQELDIDFVRSDFPALLQSMSKGTNRIKDIVHSLKNFSRLGESGQKTVSLLKGLEDALQLLEHRLGASRGADGSAAIQVVRKYGVLPTVECYFGQLNQVFFNILDNAIDALEGGRSPREITISASACTLENSSDCGVEIEIADNGCGIPLELQERIFDPFFTTKPVGSGTGMGLAICHSVVVETHGGSLKMRSSPAGTAFTMRIPCQARGMLVTS